MKEQKILSAEHHFREVREFFLKQRARKVMLVCGKSLGRQIRFSEEESGIHLVRFSDFEPNPSYEAAVRGAKLYDEEGCEAVLAVGGGSAMDVAKYIRLSAGHGTVPFAAVPATAGSGSEATTFAVLYRDGEKQSITDEHCLPDAVVFVPELLHTLPEYHKKSAMMDAFCHAIESCWSVHATAQSRQYAMQAIRLILKNMDAYLCGEDEGGRFMLFAANLAGKAINLTQTTAGHAMSYRMTSMYGIAHGHAVALCVSRLWPYMLDQEKSDSLNAAFDGLTKVMGCKDNRDAARRFERIVAGLKLGVPKADRRDLVQLKTTVNPERLKNHPVPLSEESIGELYSQILEIHAK